MSVDLFAPELYARRAERSAFATLRREGAVVAQRAPSGAPCWAVLGYAEARAVLEDAEGYCSSRGTRPGALLAGDGAAPRALNQLDGAAHERLRALADALLERSARARALRYARTATERLLRAMAARGLSDAATQLAHPLALGALAHWLGLRAPQRTALDAAVRRSHEAGAALLAAPLEAAPLEREALGREASAAKGALHALLGALLDAPDEPSETPAPAPSALATLRARLAEGACTRDEARGLLVLFAEAGYVTARDAVGNAVAGWLEDPLRGASLRRELASRDAARRARALARFTEECLRHDPPVVQFARTVTRATTLGGRALREGEQVVLFFAAANSDPRAFREPERFDPARAHNPHLSLGHGAHRCVGAALARAQLRAVVTALALRGAPLELAGPPRRRASNYLAGFEAIPVRWRRATA